MGGKTVQRCWCSGLAGGVLGLVLSGGMGAAGCVPLQRFLDQIVPPVPGNGDGNGEPNGGNGEDGLPVVTLGVSNAAPGLNEEVVLTCSVIEGDERNLVFDFEPTFGRLTVNEQRGEASFIVTETDIGLSRTFTCTAANDFGVSAPSNEVVVIPTAADPGPLPP